MRLYGSKVFVRIPEQKRKSKWDRKADLGILIGYTDTGYRVLINNKIIVAKHVDIVEENVKCIRLNGNENENDSNDGCLNDFEIQGSSETSEFELNDEQNSEFQFIDEQNSERINDDVSNEQNQEKTQKLRRSKREKKMPSKFDDNYVFNNYIYVNYCGVDIPNNFEEAMNSEECEYWRKAMDKEIECINKNKTWKLVEKPENKNIIDVKWIYTKKANNIYKARLVVRGFQQKEIIDDIYSPVAKMQTLKILLSYCCQKGLFIEQMDVETAFLNGKVISEIYINQARGYEDGTDRVCKLDKALYGLRESPRAWYDCFDVYLKKLGFKRSKFDCCLYVLKNENDMIYIILYVDDLLICCRNEEKIKYIKNLLSNKFRMKDMGKVKTYLGINIEYDCEKNVMTLSHQNYIESLAEKYKIKNLKLYKTPMEVNLKIEPAQVTCDDLKYRNLIGALLYISSGTRPDISYSVNYLSRFQNCYNESHFKYALRILKYLYLTKDLKLTYSKNETNEILDCFVDADWAGDNVDRKSTTGYVMRLFGNVIFWKSRKQGSVTKSSTFAEYVALSEAVSEIKLIKDILEIFDIENKKPVKIYEDNSGALNIAKYGNFTKNSKYIEVHYHFVNEYYMKGIIDIVKVNTNENVADIFTKSLNKNKFVKLREMLNVC